MVSLKLENARQSLLFIHAEGGIYALMAELVREVKFVLSLKMKSAWNFSDQVMPGNSTVL